THIARSGKTYHLHVSKTPTGKEKFFLSTKTDGVLAKKLPHGFEIYETVNSMVFLRRKTASIIQEEEFAMIQSGLNQIGGNVGFKAEIKKNMIVIHQADKSFGLAQPLGPWIDSAKARELKENFASYQAVMRFVLVQKEPRLFRPERFCFRGSVDDWIMLGLPAPLKSLCAKFLKHLGKDSFYDLM
ncbi:MAG: hypothetical protein WEB60_09055, partial [Terrimicrobiaceae bacterium]